jgi:predicted AlkP superfamily phosphohydrolase/phosphomutase/tetratricopeptide (TPR) repeat protein
VTPRPSGRKVLLVGWDGADWKIIQPLIDRGEMPALESIINRGVMGDLSSMRPMLSPMLWTSIATGKRPYQHGVYGFLEVDYELNQVVPVGSRTRQCKALWNILNDAGLKTQTVSWFASHPAERLNGACVTERYSHPVPLDLNDKWALSPGTVYPERLEQALAGLRVRPDEVPGDVLNMFVRDADKINQTHDKHLHQLAINLAETFTAHAAATYLLEHEPWDFATVYYHAVDLICHDFMPYHPPALPGTFSEDFLKYSDVVNSTYRLHDAMLGRLLQLAGPGTTVILVSDHGFKSDRRRPRSVPNVPAAITAWHRFHGVFAMRGEGIKQDELIYGANLLDIAPTVLNLFGLPVGNDMDGRVLREAFVSPPTVERIESWENVEDKTDTSPLNVKRVPTEERALVRQFIDLGYVADSANDPQEAIISTERENRWFLAQSQVAASHDLDALPLLEAVYEEWPERLDFATELGLCQLRLGLIAEARETLQPIIENKRGGAAVILISAQLEYYSKHYDAALKLLEQAEALDPRFAPLQNQLGATRLRLGQIDLAERAYRKAVEREPDDAQGYFGVAVCRIKARDWEQAADYALRAIAIRFDAAPAHHYLGIALARLGEDERAIQAFETCLRYTPGFNAAHRYLITLYKRQPERTEDVQRHRDFLRGHIARRKRATRFRGQLRREAAARAAVRAQERDRARKQARALPVEASDSTIEPTEFLIVSGLPRSGTSLMMSMLDAAGVPIMTDAKRVADESNPRGYFEWEAVKNLPRNKYVIEQAAGRAVKVVSMLLPSLPTKHRYRVIFMQRAIDDVAGSQEKMRQKLTHAAATDSAKMVQSLTHHRDRMLQMMKQTPNADVLEIDYADLLENPRANAERVAEFAKIDKSKIDNMVAVVDPSLRHFGGALVDQVSAKS